MSRSLPYEKRWRLDRAMGVDRSYMPRAEVLPHLEALVAAGATRTGIARIAGCSPTTVAKIIRPTSDRTGEWVQRPVGRRLLAVTLEQVRARPDASGLVPALGSRRRVQALLAMGWTHQLITEAMRRHGSAQMSGTVLHQRGVLVERRTADAIAGAFQEFGLRPGPSAVTRRRAAAQGYVSPLAWDDIDADDAPRGTRRADSPSSLTDGLDHADLERLLAGEPRRLGPVARVAAIVELVRHGYNDRQMAELLLVTERTITRDRMRHGITPAKEWASRSNGSRRGADVAEVAA